MVIRQGLKDKSQLRKLAKSGKVVFRRKARSNGKLPAVKLVKPVGDLRKLVRESKQ